MPRKKIKAKPKYKGMFETVSKPVDIVASLHLKRLRDLKDLAEVYGHREIKIMD